MDNNNFSLYNAHYNPVTGIYQSNYEHNTKTAAIAVGKCTDSSLINTLWLICTLHDAGKGSDKWQEYFQKAIEHSDISNGYKEDHTTAGGQIIEEICPKTLLSQMVQTVIYSHHGLQDCISPSNSCSLFDKRHEKAKMLPIYDCREQFYKENDQNEVMKRCVAAQGEMNVLKKRIIEKMKSWGQLDCFGRKDFFLGMYVRYLLSLLIDADRRNTEDFMSGTESSVTICSKTDIQQIWEICVENVDKKISSFKDKRGINACRSEISEACRNVAENPKKLYQLTVPTGSGKTLSSLRFAVHNAKKFKKKRIIYVAPFQSIVEQNADEIRKAVGMPEIVLEHHCNIVIENDEERERYDRITEDWDSPIVVTTAVQFLNTLFAGKTSNVRRMHSLSYSVIIIDEVQALPVRVLELFNVAINFLTEFLDTTIVLCTATQPLLDRLKRNRLRPVECMIEKSDFYRDRLRRTEIVNCTSQKPGGMDIEDVTGFILEKVKKYKKVLFIANTKACARKIYKKLKELCGEEIILHHLSTNMYPEHRREVLSQVRASLQKENLQICISTQLIEAGVDISFRCVIRSLAGLDNIVQSAGRCNRNKELSMGYVFLIHMNKNEENVSKLAEIRKAQEAVWAVLDQFERNPNSLDNYLDSEKAIQMYFDKYYNQCENEMCYPVTIANVPTSIMELLTKNADFVKKGQTQILKQAFKTAGEEFEAITEQGKISIVINDRDIVAVKLSDLENPYISLSRKKQIMRELQSYTVSVSQNEKDKLSSGIYGVWDKRILVLEDRFYNSETGITTEAKPMQDLQL